MARPKTKAVNPGFGLGVDYLIVKSDPWTPLLPASVVAGWKDAGWSTTGSRTGIRLSGMSPGKDLRGAADHLAAEVNSMNTLVRERAGAMLLPTGAYPFSAALEMQGSGIEQGFDAGWPWTSAAHIEIPFTDESMFARLHTAIRMVLPLIPAISASSPFLQGKRARGLSGRVLAMLNGTTTIPELTGNVIPEVALDQADYYRIVLEPIARALAERGLVDSVDYQQVNRRAAVPSFERSLITIHLADTQECISADVAVAEMIITVVQAMMQGRWVSNYLQRAWHEADLRAILKDVARLGGDALIANRDFLLMFGMMRESATTAELWRHLYQQLRTELSESTRIRVAHILDQGCLAQRILHRLGDRPPREKLEEVYRELARCLQENRPFDRSVAA